MFTFQTTVKCDYYGCKNTLQVEVELSTDDRGIAVFDYYPFANGAEGWALSLKKKNHWADREPCLCPEHNKK